MSFTASQSASTQQSILSSLRWTEARPNGTFCRPFASLLTSKSRKCRKRVIVEGQTQEPQWTEDAWDRVGSLSDIVSENFAGVVVLSCSIAFLYPRPFLWIRSETVSIALAVSMLAMGCTLKLQDFAILSQYPFRIFIGVLLQYTVMPSVGFCLSRLTNLSPAVAAGLVLVACCPGGVASNLVTYIANGDVAMSVAMTSISTLLAIGLTPLLTAALIGTLVPVDGWGLFLSTIQVILMPLVMGVTLKRLFPEMVKRMERVAPLVAVMAVTSINCGITARHVDALLQSGLTILAAVACLHILGFALGSIHYLLAAAMKLPPKSCSTISIEVGMQNSGLGAVLAMKHFGDPLSSCACVVSACFHSVAGGLFASWLRKQNRGNS